MDDSFFDQSEANSTRFRTTLLLAFNSTWGKSESQKYVLPLPLEPYTDTLHITLCNTRRSTMEVNSRFLRFLTHLKSYIPHHTSSKYSLQQRSNSIPINQSHGPSIEKRHCFKQDWPSDDFGIRNTVVRETLY